MKRLLALLGLLAGQASAETAVVYSGEHEDFTRLVIELPAAQDWTVGRTAMGYAFAAAGVSQPVYDTSQVWSRIPKTRLQALQTDAETGALRLTLACDCHVFPFEYQPGIVVLDIKPGPAPDGSTFELAFALLSTDGTPLNSSAKLAPSYDWLDSEAASATPALAETDLALLTGATLLAPLRDELLQEISRGAARGVVDMALPKNPPTPDPSGYEAVPWSQIHIGPPLETSITEVAEGKDGRRPDGEVCIPDDLLVIADWGRGRRPLDLLTEARSGLYGEFDVLDQEAALRAVRLHLYLGFGAEAAQYAKLLPDLTPDGQAAMLRSMALIIDGAPDPGSPFADMLACDGAVSLWAALALDRHPPGAVVNSRAIARSFLALPAHLRTALGEALAERLLALDEAEAARIVGDAVGRSPDVASATVDLLDAKAELHAGEPESALSYAEAAIASDGGDVAAWIALVEAHFRNGEPLSPASAEALRAFEGEVDGTEKEADYFRALALAEILSGQAAAGFTIAEEKELPRSDLWQVAVNLAEDDTFLRHAVSTTPDLVAVEVANAVADRLVGLGFPDAAMAWLNPTGLGDTPERRRIAAKAELARRDARQSLVLLQGLSEPDDHALRAEALLQLGRIAEAREAYDSAGLAEASLRLAAWESSWTDLEAADLPLWTPALVELDQAPSDAAGPLARGAAIVDASAASRVSIKALLAGISSPEP